MPHYPVIESEETDFGVVDEEIALFFAQGAIQHKAERSPYMVHYEGKRGETILIPLISSKLPIFQDLLLAITLDKNGKVLVHQDNNYNYRTCKQSAKNLLVEIHQNPNSTNGYYVENRELYIQAINACLENNAEVADFFEIDTSANF